MEPNTSSIPGASDPVVKFSCLNLLLAIAPLLKQFKSLVITSGTLSPIDLYPKLLVFDPYVSECFGMSTFCPCIRPLVITRRIDQMAMSTKYDERGDLGVIPNYGKSILHKHVIDNALTIINILAIVASIVFLFKYLSDLILCRS